LNKKILLLIGLIVLTLVGKVSAVQVCPPTTFNIQNEYYRFSTCFNFSVIQVNTTEITFNTTVFNITSTNQINITFYALANYTLINFISNTTSPGTVWFNITGLQTSTNYTILVNNTYNTTNTTTSRGNLSFELSHGAGNRNIYIRASTTQVRITAKKPVTDVVTISDNVIKIVGIALIVGALLVIVIALQKAGHI